MATAHDMTDTRPALPPGIAPLAAHLREATRASHRRLDHHPLLAALLQPSLTLTLYGRVLAALHGAQGAIESRLADFAPPALLPPRLPVLSSDLAALGMDPFPLTVAVPPSAAAAEKLGLLYVVEGSNLGGAVIARQLVASLPESAPRAFFGGAEGPRRWQRFWTFAHTHDLKPDHFEAAAGAARACFEFYRLHLDRCLDCSDPGLRKNS
jgi:heme oxygenase